MPSVKVAKTTEVPAGLSSELPEPEGSPLRVRLLGESLIAYRTASGTVGLMQNSCPHRGGPMGEGDLDGRVAVCPWHGWRWDVTTGANANNPAVKIACFPTRVENGDVYVELP